MTEREIFYGRRRGHKLSPRRRRLMETLLPEVGISLEGVADETLAPAALFPSKIDDYWLEIGFGKGEHLAWQAARNPDIGFIGCDPFIDGVAGLLARIEEEGFANIRVYPEDARPFLRALKAGSIGRVFLIHPDPWPKRRHAKRRFVNQTNLDQLARIMKPRAELRISSDHAVFIAWTLLEMQNRKDFRWTAERAADWREAPAGWPETRYRAKARAERRAPAYLTFVRA